MKDMKRVILVALMAMAATGLKAQDCETLLLPYFQNDRAVFEQYRQQVPDKLAWRCAYARSAFYESDTIPAGAERLNITEVVNLETNVPLSADFVVNLSTLSYWAYNFQILQYKFPTGATTIYFATPASKHPYLVLRSLDDTNAEATKLWESEGYGRGRR